MLILIVFIVLIVFIQQINFKVFVIKRVILKELFNRCKIKRINKMNKR